MKPNRSRIFCLACRLDEGNLDSFWFDINMATHELSKVGVYPEKSEVLSIVENLKARVGQAN